METHTDRLAQELVEHIITLLHNSPLDLLSCALVSRRWADPAQSHIFRRISFGGAQLDNERLWDRLREALTISPHLIRHIRQLDVYGLQLSMDTFTAICSFPFTHLDGISFLHIRLGQSCVIGLQRVLSLPSLRRVRINFHFAEPAPFFQIWDRCAPGLRHLELLLQHPPDISFESRSPHDFPSTVRLESLRITGPSEIQWLMHGLHPFDFSYLRFLSIYGYMEILQSPKFVPALQTIETLDFLIDEGLTIDLSPFPSLTLIHMSVYSGKSWPSMFLAFSTIVPSNRISKIIINITGNENSLTQNNLAQLDSQLSELPMQHPPVVEFEMGLVEYERIIAGLPRSRSKNMLRRADYERHWFRGITGVV
ncbi:hypothetical protein C8R44DRAFT_806805 [Mycena epipterygia]|nr:hypothetical protein C8R44DRAFT_806805 [Mycena epipterygia]